MSKILKNYSYQKVNTNLRSDVKRSFSWIPFLRQLLVCSGIWNSFFMTGMCLGIPTVLIPQLRKEANATSAVSEEVASWMSSIHGFAAVPWVVILPVLSAWIGRKYPFLIISVCSLASFILFYFSTTMRDILIVEAMHSILLATTITISVIIVIEYTSPRYRGMCLTLKSASFNWGMWVSNALGTFFHWRVIGQIGIVLSFYNILTTLLWCESLYWLASKYRFEASAKAHRWIKGEDEYSEKELESLIESQKEVREAEANKRNKRKRDVIKVLYATVIQKSFYKPVLLCITILSLYQFTGKMVCSMYAIDIIRNITLTESTAYVGMLILDGVSVLGMYVGCGLSKILKRRTLLITATCIGITFLFIISIYLFLVHLEVVKENKYVSLGLLVVFALSMSCGPMILSTSMYAELIPLRFKTSCMVLLGFYSVMIMAVFLKLGPFVFKTFNLFGAFLFYGVLSSTGIFVLYKYLPETKDKTLHEIENYFKET